MKCNGKILTFNRTSLLCLVSVLSAIVILISFVTSLSVHLLLKFTKKNISPSSSLKSSPMARAYAVSNFKETSESRHSDDGNSVQFQVPQSRQTTLAFHLNNGLRVFLTSSPKVSQSGAALSVGAGSFDDPAEYPGLAHLCEHMILRGKEKCNGKEELCNYVTLHGGEFQGLTRAQTTNFIFTIQSQYFDKALFLFSKLFTKPVFDEDSLKAELKIVNEEHALDLQKEMNTILFLLKYISRKEHRFHRFNSGNNETLNKKGLLSKLKQFYSEKYSANKVSIITG